MASGGPGKAVLVVDATEQALRSCLGGLELPRRALSLPITAEAPAALPNFVELWGDVSELRAVIEAWPHPARAWLVAEFVPFAYDRSWPSGEPSPGLRMISTVHRHPDLSRDEFAAYWRGPHTAVAKRYTVPVWNYVQNVVVEALGHDSEIDGFVGMHFRTAEDRRARWHDHPEEARRGAEDAVRFMDVERSASMLAVETVWDEASRGARIEET
jgi:hypothetical protein